MEKVIPLIKSFKTIFYIKNFELGKVQFGLNKIWTGLIWIRIQLNRLEPVWTTGRHCVRSHPSVPQSLPCPMLRNAALSRAHRQRVAAGRPPVRSGPLPIPSAAWSDPKPGPPPLIPLAMTALKGVVVDRCRASFFSPVAGAEATLQRRPGSTLRFFAVAEVLVSRLLERRMPPGGRFSVETLRCVGLWVVATSPSPRYPSSQVPAASPPSLATSQAAASPLVATPERHAALFPRRSQRPKVPASTPTRARRLWAVFELSPCRWGAPFLSLSHGGAWR
jgi:hypothetical protein